MSQKHIDRTLQNFVASCVNEEGGKSEVKMGDAFQFLKIANRRLGGKLYDLIRENGLGEVEAKGVKDEYDEAKDGVMFLDEPEIEE